jgi:hypothetical protein
VEFQPESKGQRRFLFQSFQRKPFTKQVPKERTERTERKERNERKEKAEDFSFVEDEEEEKPKANPKANPKEKEPEIFLPVK